MRRPVNSPYQITQKYGYDPGYPLNNGVHIGVDYVSNDRLVIAPESGTVQVKPNDGNCGNAIYLSTRNTYHAFCHLSQFKVQNNQQVTEGQVLGVMGQTGAATGVHLHWAVRFKGELVDGESIIKEEDMYQGKSAAEWAKDAANATAVATERLKHLDKIAQSAGVYQPNEEKKKDTIIKVVEDLKGKTDYVQVGTIDDKPVYRRKD